MNEVTALVPEEGKLAGDARVADGRSYENTPVTVPVCPATVTARSCPRPRPFAYRHLIDVSDTHTFGLRVWGLGFRVQCLWFREQLLHKSVQRFRGGLVAKAHRLCASLNSRLESNKEEEGVGFTASSLALCPTRACRDESAVPNNLPVRNAAAE